MASWMLVDGNSLTYRAFFALPSDLATASGQVTNAVFGFASMLINLVRDHKPDHIVVAFDRPEPTFRHKALDSYKANRESAPDILRQQMGLVRELVDVLALPTVELAGFEADDLIATLAEKASNLGDDVLVVTGDRDSYQLVRDPHIRVLYNRRGVSDYALYDEAGIHERTGVRPDQYVDYAAMRGDNSDNLPGVPGVGEKTAAKLITSYGDLDGIYAHLDDLTPKLRQNLADNEAHVRRNAELMVLVRDVPLDSELSGFERGTPDNGAVVEFFQFLEMNSLLPRLAEAFTVDVAPASSARVLVAEVTTWSDAAAARQGLANLRDAGVAVAVEMAWDGAPGRSAPLGLAVGSDAEMGEVFWLPAALFDDCADALAQLLDGSVPIWAHDAKATMRGLLRVGVDLQGLAVDTKIAAYLLDPADTRYALSDLLERFADAELGGDDVAPAGQLNLGDATTEHSEACATRALGVLHLVPEMMSALDARSLSELNRTVEVPLVRVLARMEDVGLGVDVPALRALNERLVTEAAELRAAIVEAAGEDFNVNSTPQLRHILFDKLGLTTQKKTKTGYSTDAATLEKLRGDHPIVELLLRYREVEKLRSTYGEGLLAEVGSDGRIHATFNQTVARTGRLSSDAPNLHNIPVRSAEGRLFRDTFVPREGWKFVVADYNQIELRCIAHLAGDPGLIEAFTSGTDIHNQTAARIFGVDADAVTVEQRSKSKMVSYGLAYGMEAYGLGQRLGIPTGEAQEILDAYFAAFPAVHSYMEQTVKDARERGYTETLFGRRRQIPELASKIRSVRQAGERQAMNAGIQGLAADIFKIALVRLDDALGAADLAARIVLQVHDEVLVETPPAEVSQVSDLVVASMTGAFDMQVPLVVNLSTGNSWGEAK